MRRGIVRTLLGQAATGVPRLQDRRGESLLSRISGLRLGPPLKPAPAGATQRAPGGGQGGSRRWNHKAASLAGRGHSHKTDPLKAAETRYLPRTQSSMASASLVFPAEAIVTLTVGETETRSLNYQRVAGGRNERVLFAYQFFFCACCGLHSSPGALSVHRTGLQPAPVEGHPGVRDPGGSEEAAKWPEKRFQTPSLVLCEGI